MELARAAYEDGDWATAVAAAHTKGRETKARKRMQEALALELETKEGQEWPNGPISGAKQRAKEGREMAQGLMEWVDKWWAIAASN